MSPKDGKGGDSLALQDTFQRPNQDSGLGLRTQDPGLGPRTQEASATPFATSAVADSSKHMMVHVQITSFIILSDVF